MRTLQLGVATTLEFYREDPTVTMTQVQIVDTDDGSVLETIATASITDDTASVNPTEAIDAETYTFTAVGLVKDRDYLIQPEHSYQGKAQRVHIVVRDVNGNQGEIRHEFFNSYDTSATFKGILSTCSYTPASTLLNREVLIIWTDSDNRTYRSQAVLVKYKSQNPIRHHDIIKKFPRLVAHVPEWQEREGVGFQPQSDEVWDHVGTLLYRNGVILDRLSDPDAIRPLLWIHIERVFSESGIDPSGRADRDEAIKDFNKKSGRELKKVLALRLFVDNDETNIHTDQTVSRTMHNSAYQTIQKDWRDQA